MLSTFFRLCQLARVPQWEAVLFRAVELPRSGASLPRPTPRRRGLGS
jgi:hypothetical protein